MRPGSLLITAILAASLLLTGISPFINSQSGNPCSGCHGGTYQQYLDILEGDAGNKLPTVLNDSEVLTVAVVLKNICNAGSYNVMTSISATLSSQNGCFGVQTPTSSIGALSPGQTGKATWQIYAKARGLDTLVISAQGQNSHYACQFLDGYSPAAAIFVNKTVIDNPPTISIGSPQAGLRLTGGTDHTVSWTASDEDRPNCAVALYYSTDDFRTTNETISTGIAADQTYTWNLPRLDCSTVRLKASIVDPKGQYCDRLMGGCFTIDSTPPTVTSVQPPDSGKNTTDSAVLVVSFSEPVAKDDAEDAFTISPGLAWVIWTWNTDQTVMTATHAAFEAGTVYTCSVSGAVRDRSSPGNRLAGAFHWSFSTPAVMVPVPSAVLSSPSGGERYWWGDRIPVRWSASGGTGALGINLSLSDSGPAGPFTIVAGRLPNLGNYSLKAPEHVSDDCIMKATVYDQDWVESSCLGGTFSIARRLELNATYPLSDGQVPGGATVDITWTSEGGHGTASVSLYFRPNASSGFEAVASGLPPSGGYRWTAPEMNCTGALLVLNATDDWNRSVEATSEEFIVRSSRPPPPPPQPPVPTRPNRPPVIRFDLLQSRVVVDGPASFDASGSFDPDGDALYYRWDFGDGSGIVNITSPKTTHSFPYAGTYNVMLVAGDGRNETYQAMAILVSSGTPPGAPSAGGDWQVASLGIVIIIIGSVGVAYSAAGRPPSRPSDVTEGPPAAGAASERQPAESQAEAAARAYAALYGAPAADQQASAQATASTAGAAQPPVGAEPQFPVLLDAFRCVGCGTCAASCPFQAITMAGDRPMLDCARCTGCGHCIGNCVQGALCMNPAFTDTKAV